MVWVFISGLKCLLNLSGLSLYKWAEWYYYCHSTFFLNWSKLSCKNVCGKRGLFWCIYSCPINQWVEKSFGKPVLKKKWFLSKNCLWKHRHICLYFADFLHWKPYVYFLLLTYFFSFWPHGIYIDIVSCACELNVISLFHMFRSVILYS